MNKLSKIAVVFAMAMILLAMPALAASSATTVAEVVSAVNAQGEEVAVTSCGGGAGVTAEDAAAVLGVDAAQVSTVYDNCLDVEEDCTVTLHVAGTAGKTIYVLAAGSTGRAAGGCSIIATGTGEDITISLAKGHNAITIVVVSSANSGNTSDKTGEGAGIAIAAAVAVAAGAVAVVSYRKKVNG